MPKGATVKVVKEKVKKGAKAKPMKVQPTCPVILANKRENVLEDVPEGSQRYATGDISLELRFFTAKSLNKKVTHCLNV